MATWSAESAAGETETETNGPPAVGPRRTNVTADGKTQACFLTQELKSEELSGLHQILD